MQSLTQNSVVAQAASRTAFDELLHVKQTLTSELAARCAQIGELEDTVERLLNSRSEWPSGAADNIGAHERVSGMRFLIFVALL